MTWAGKLEELSTYPRTATSNCHNAGAQVVGSSVARGRCRYRTRAPDQRKGHGRLCGQAWIRGHSDTGGLACAYHQTGASANASVVRTVILESLQAYKRHWRGLQPEGGGLTIPASVETFSPFLEHAFARLVHLKPLGKKETVESGPGLLWGSS